jgi:hypothetical protein
MLAEVAFLQESAVQLSRNIAMRFVVRMMPNDPSSATRRAGRNDCNRDAPAGFVAAHG